MNTKNKIYITKYDYDRLKNMIHEYTKANRADGNIKDLLGEIERAQKVEKMQELDFQLFKLVFPEEADIDKNKISVLAPIGTAVLGYKVGDVIKWKVPDGEDFFQITNILYQPEANGDYHL